MHSDLGQGVKTKQNVILMYTFIHFPSSASTSPSEMKLRYDVAALRHRVGEQKVIIQPKAPQIVP